VKGGFFSPSFRTQGVSQELTDSFFLFLIAGMVAIAPRRSSGPPAAKSFESNFSARFSHSPDARAKSLQPAFM